MNNNKQCGLCCEYFNKIDLISNYSKGGESHTCKKCETEYKLYIFKNNIKNNVVLHIYKNNNEFE